MNFIFFSLQMIAISLIPYTHSFLLPRSFIINSLPHSVLASALLEEPNATLLEIPNPDVTPNAMQVLVDYSQGKESDHSIPEVRSTERYLNIPWLLYYTDPLYDEIPNRANIQDPKNKEVWERAIKENRE